MIDPVLIMGCGHSACKRCEGRLTSKNCPECGTAYQGVSHNIALKKSASNLKFRCEHCKLEGKMGCVKQHLSVCPKYPCRKLQRVQRNVHQGPGQRAWGDMLRGRGVYWYDRDARRIFWGSKSAIWCYLGVFREISKLLFWNGIFSGCKNKKTKSYVFVFLLLL